MRFKLTGIEGKIFQQLSWRPCIGVLEFSNEWINSTNSEEVNSKKTKLKIWHANDVCQESILTEIENADIK